jgi:hypothetical protein
MTSTDITSTDMTGATGMPGSSSEVWFQVLRGAPPEEELAALAAVLYALGQQRASAGAGEQALRRMKPGWTRGTHCCAHYRAHYAAHYRAPGSWSAYPASSH